MAEECSPSITSPTYEIPLILTRASPKDHIPPIPRQFHSSAMRPPSMPYDALQLAFARTGSGPPVVMIHGNPATHTLWNAAPSRLRRGFAGGWSHVSYGKGYSPKRAAEVAMEADRKGLVRALCGLVREADYNSYGDTLNRLGAAHHQPLLLLGAGE